MRQRVMTAEEQEVHAGALRLLNRAGIHYVVSGAVALGYYTGIWRHTKDLDLFVVRDDLAPALALLASHGYVIARPAAHWVASGRKGEYYVDLIHGFGGWFAPVDARWYERGPLSSVLGQPVRVAPVEELIWIKSFVAHRERFDGADILHLIQACHASLDWEHLLARFGDAWQLLLFYIGLYFFVYPDDRSDIPAWLTRELTDRWRQLPPAQNGGLEVCRGTLLDRFSFLVDIQHGFVDGRTPFAEAQGWSEQDLARDRLEAETMVQEGRVNPDRAA
jgi:hypothetical protein